MNEYKLIQYLKGCLDSTAAGEVEEWILLSAENRKTAEDMYLILFVSERMDAKKEVNIDQVYNEFREKYLLTKSSSKKTKTIGLWKKVASIAAIFVAILALGAFTTVAVLELNSQSTIIATQLGERAQITLPDGSKVWLNACSSLEYRKSFFSRKRTAELSGEAYFDVAHNASFPFVVMNEGSEIKVLGTTFNVRCNNDENFLTASLFDGSIRFSDTNNAMAANLNPGEKITFDRNTHQFKIDRITSAEDVTSWMEGKLIFGNASLEEIARSLEKHYNVHILFKDEAAKEIRFNAEFEMADNIYQILSILELTDKFTYEINRRDVVISSKK